MLDDNTRRAWKNMAQSHLRLRFPNVSLDVASPFNYTSQGVVRAATFVRNKQGDRLTYVEVKYPTTKSTDIFDHLENVKLDFTRRCTVIQEEFTFPEDNSIKDPYQKVN